MTGRIKIIGDDREHEEALRLVDSLMDAEPGTDRADDLRLVAKLVSDYERMRYPVERPTPVEAIRFRMEQEGLEARDLEPIIGSRSRVSQILGGVRPLSIDMIRAVHRHLGIPAEILIGEETREGEPELPAGAAVLLRSWGLLGRAEGFASLMRRACLNGRPVANFRKTRTPRTNAKTNPVALEAWQAGALLLSGRSAPAKQFDRKAVGPEALRALSTLSSRPDGPALAIGALAELGIVLVRLPHLPETYIDGAAIMRDDGVPVIALTIRRDRIDNFWFTLLHECVHVALHLEPGSAILDDLEIGSLEDVEQEADQDAMDALIPPELWRSFNSGPYASVAQVEALASAARVHPAIVAGRWQNQNRDFRKFSRLLGHGEVRRFFPDP